MANFAFIHKDVSSEQFLHCVCVKLWPDRNKFGVSESTRSLCHASIQLFIAGKSPVLFTTSKVILKLFRLVNQPCVIRSAVGSVLLIHGGVHMPDLLSRMEILSGKSIKRRNKSSWCQNICRCTDFFLSLEIAVPCLVSRIHAMQEPGSALKGMSTVNYADIHHWERSSGLEPVVQCADSWMLFDSIHLLYSDFQLEFKVSGY